MSLNESEAPTRLAMEGETATSVEAQYPLMPLRVEVTGSIRNCADLPGEISWRPRRLGKGMRKENSPMKRQEKSDAAIVPERYRKILLTDERGGKGDTVRKR